MFDSFFGWIIIIGISIWGYIKYIKKPIKPSTSRMSSSSEQKFIQDEYLVNIENYAKQVDAEIKIEVEQYKKELDQKYALDLEKKKYLSDFAKQHYLDKALINIWKEIKFYPKTNINNFKQTNKFNISNCIGENYTENNKKIEKVSFDWCQSKWELVYVEYRSCAPDGGTNADFSLYENSEAVFKIHTSKEYDEFGDSYNCFSIESFKKKGNWYRFLLESQKLIEINKRNMEASWKYINADKIKDNFQVE